MPAGPESLEETAIPCLTCTNAQADMQIFRRIQGLSVKGYQGGPPSGFPLICLSLRGIFISVVEKL